MTHVAPISYEEFLKNVAVTHEGRHDDRTMRWVEETTAFFMTKAAAHHTIDDSVLEGLGDDAIKFTRKKCEAEATLTLWHLMHDMFGGQSAQNPDMHDRCKRVVADAMTSIRAAVDAMHLDPAMFSEFAYALHRLGVLDEAEFKEALHG